MSKKKIKSNLRINLFQRTIIFHRHEKCEHYTFIIVFQYTIDTTNLSLNLLCFNLPSKVKFKPNLLTHL